MSECPSVTKYHIDACGFNMWNDIITPLIISPILLILKILYDKITSKKYNSMILKNKSKLEKISSKLQKFYWPLYIRLLSDYYLFSQFKIFSDSFYETLEFKKNINNHSNLNTNYIPPNVIEKIHSNSNLENFFNNSSNIKNINNKYVVGNFTGKNPGEIKGLNDTNINKKTELTKNAYTKVRNSMIENQQIIRNLIQDNISIGEPNSKIGKEIFKYLRFTIIVNCIIDEDNFDPYIYNANYPLKLLPLVELKVFNLQKEYNDILEHYYYD